MKVLQLRAIHTATLTPNCSIAHSRHVKPRSAVYHLIPTSTHTKFFKVAICTLHEFLALASCAITLPTTEL